MQDRYIELLNFELKATNILQTRAYDISDEEKVLVIKNWLDQEDLLSIETSKQEEKEKWKTTQGLFSFLTNKFRPCHNLIIISLQYWKFKRKSNESVQE